MCDTVKEEIALAIRNYMKGCKDINKRVSDSLKLVGLDDSFIDKNPNNLSYIEQKKIIFATFISYNPKIIIIDGYEQGMTFKERDSLKKMLRLLKVRYNKTIIIISNDINFIMDIVDSYVVINSGVNVLEGTKNDFYKEELYQYDSVEKTIQRYNTLILDMYKEQSDKYYLYLLCSILVLGVVIVTFSTILISMNKRNRRKKIEFVSNKKDEVDEDLPIKRNKSKKRK